MKKSVCFNRNLLLKTSGGAMSKYNYLDPGSERHRLI